LSFGRLVRALSPKIADLQTYYDKYPDWKDQIVLVAASVDATKAALTKLESKRVVANAQRLGRRGRQKSLSR